MVVCDIKAKRRRLLCQVHNWIIMVFQAKARSYNQQTLVVGCISNKKSMKKPPAGICPMRPSRPGVDFYKLILHFFYVLNGLINNTSLDIRSICQVIPQMISGWPFTHSWFRQYFRSNLYGRAPRGPRGVIKSDLIFLKWKCWVFALRLPQKGTNFEKPSKLEKNVKKHLFS